MTKTRFPINTRVCVAGDQAAITYVVDSLPAVDNGKVYVTLPDQSQGFWVDPGQLVREFDPTAYASWLASSYSDGFEPSAG